MKPHEEWLFKAGHDLESARILSAAEPPMLDIAVYHAQQCAEKAFKAIFCFHGQEVPRTHNLPLLLEKCAELDRRIGSLIDDAVFLNPYATLYRYPDGELMPTVAETEKAIAAARRALAAAQELTR